MAESFALFARKPYQLLDHALIGKTVPRGAVLLISLALIAASACSGGGMMTPASTGGAGGTGPAGSGTGGSGGVASSTGGQSGGTGGVGVGGAEAGVSDQDAAASNDAPSESATTGTVPHPPLNGTVKIMVVGSSNEEGTCWRAFLWKKLRDAGITNFDFVGRHNAGPECPGTAGYDKDCEAHGGTVVENISADAWLQTFMANPPDIVLQHNGGADLLGGRAYPGVIKAYTLAVTQARMVNPHVIYIAAQHTPQGGAQNVKDVIDLNAAMVPWAAGLTTTAAPVILVDLFTGIDQKTDMSDGTHLNISGSQKVSDRWLATLMPMFKP
jgi:hypothetical protein